MHLDQKPDMTLKWLFLDLNSYFASVEQQENRHLRGKPVAVVPMMTDGTCAIAASYEAKAYGIKTGTKIYEAKRKCPGLICVLARHDMYVDYHHRVLDEIENHIPVTKKCSIDEVACHLLGAERDPDNAIALARRIKQGIWDNVGETINCSIGIASNKYLAKIAADFKKPDGLTVFNEDNLYDCLTQLRLTDLTGINTRMEYRLHRARIYTVEQFLNLAPKHARKIWGSVGGEQLWYRLHGYDIPDRLTNKSVIGHSRILDPQLRTPPQAYKIIRLLTVKAATRLRRYELYTDRLSLGIRTVDKKGWFHERTFPATQDNQVLLDALEFLWRQMLYDVRGVSLKKVSVSLYGLKKPEQVTLDLFDYAAAKDKPKKYLHDHKLSQTLDEINKRFGANTVSLGAAPKTTAGFVGTKIAFNRIPEKAEFRE